MYDKFYDWEYHPGVRFLITSRPGKIRGDGMVSFQGVDLLSVASTPDLKLIKISVNYDNSNPRSNNVRKIVELNDFVSRGYAVKRADSAYYDVPKESLFDDPEEGSPEAQDFVRLLLDRKAAKLAVPVAPPEEDEFTDFAGHPISQIDEEPSSEEAEPTIYLMSEIPSCSGNSSMAAIYKAILKKGHPDPRFKVVLDRKGVGVAEVHVY